MVLGIEEGKTDGGMIVEASELGCAGETGKLVNHVDTFVS